MENKPDRFIFSADRSTSIPLRLAAEDLCVKLPCPMCGCREPRPAHVSKMRRLILDLERSTFPSAPHGYYTRGGHGRRRHVGDRTGGGVNGARASSRPTNTPELTSGRYGSRRGGGRRGLSPKARSNHVWSTYPMPNAVPELRPSPCYD